MTGLLFLLFFKDSQETSLNFPVNEKSPPGRIALRRKGMMSLLRPVAGGESCRSRIHSDVCEKMEKELRFVRIRALNRAANRDRTGTGITTHGILSPGRLPVPPLRHMDGDGFEPSKQFAADLQSVPFGHSGIRPCILFCVRMTSDID